MGWNYSHIHKHVSIAVLFAFVWLFGGVYEIALAAKDGDQRAMPRVVKDGGRLLAVHNQQTAVSSRQKGLIPPSLGDTPLSIHLRGGQGWGGYKDGLLLTAFNPHPNEPVLLASNGLLTGLLTAEFDIDNSPSPLEGEGRGEGDKI